MKKIILFSFLLSISTVLLAKDLVQMDSIGIEKVGDKTFIIHQVAEKETLFGISRRYQTAVNDILQTNPQLEDGLKIGQRIRVPYIAKEAAPKGSIIHKVAPGETMFSISRKYNVSVGDILSWNNLQGSDLSVGQSLTIQGVQPVVEKVAEAAPQPAPVQKESGQAIAATSTPSNPVPSTTSAPSTPSSAPVKSETTPNTTNIPGNWISHTVSQGETLYSIARQYEAKVDDLMIWNNLTSNDLSVGQKLKVGREQNANVPVITSSIPVKVNNERSEAVLATNPEVVSRNEDTAYKNIKQTGLAEVIEGTGNHKKYLVLHREAPVGTIMRVRNEENDVTIFARVVGKLPETGDNSKLVIKLSKAAYDQLRAVNARFPVEISY